MQLPQAGILRTGKGPKWKDRFVLYYEVEKGGMVTLSELYIHVHKWFAKEGFKHWGSNDGNIEDLYLQRMRPDGVQENLIWWRTYKDINPYLSYMCKMDWQNFGAKDTEIVYKEKKVKTQKLGIVLRVWWWVQLDPENRWEKSFLGKMNGGRLTRWFYERMLNNELEMHEEKVRTLAKRQENEIKEYFEMATSRPMPRSFFPEEGYKWQKPKPRPEDFANLPRKPDFEI